MSLPARNRRPRRFPCVRLSAAKGGGGASRGGGADFCWRGLCLLVLGAVAGLASFAEARELLAPPPGLAGGGEALAAAAPQVPVRLPGQRQPFAGCLIKSLSVRFDEEMHAHRWAAIYAQADEAALAPVACARPATPGGKGSAVSRAVHLAFTDVETGERWAAVPDRMARSGGMFSILRGGDAVRFYAGTLHSTNDAELLEWHVLSDDSSGDARVYHMQISAPLGTPRRLRAHFWLGDHALAELRTAAPAPWIEAEGIPLWLDLSEPRRCRLLVAPGGTPVGYEFDLGVTPATGNFPAVAAFAVTAATRLATTDAAPPSSFHAAPDRLPLPEALGAGDWSGVMAFRPCLGTPGAGAVAEAEGAGEDSDAAFLAALTASAEVADLAVSEWATSAFQCLMLPPDGRPVARLDARTCWVNPDPDLPTILSLGPNRAQTVLYAVQGTQPPPAAVLLDLSGLAAAPLDTRERAIYLCDFPLVWANPADSASPLGVRLGDAAAEFAASLACQLHRLGIPLLVYAQADDELAPYLFYHADALVVPAGEAAAAAAAPLAAGRPVLPLPAALAWWPAR